MREIICDLETDGLLHEVTKVNLFVIRYNDGDGWSPVYTYREHEAADALALLSTADVFINHNLIGYDLPVLEKLYPEWDLKEGCIIRDTLIMARMCFAAQKDKDFKLHREGKLEGKYIGRHELGAWGQRMGLAKGDYAKVREAKAKEQGITDPDEIRKFVWGEWNEDLETYGIRDAEVTTLLWERIKAMNWDPVATKLEHRITHIMTLQEHFGFTLNVEKAQELAAELRGEYNRLHAIAVETVGKWFRPKKIYREEPRAQYGEDDSRRTWAEVVVPTKTLRYKDPMRADREEGVPFCPVELKEFNPNSRPQIIDRLQVLYEWEPVDFTETGQPEVSDDVLRPLAEQIPLCDTLAELFFLNKALGALEQGRNAWLGLVREGKIHGYVNCGGTVSRRASHLSPNMAQVKKVKVVDIIDKNTGELNKKIINKETGKPYDWCYDDDGTLKKKTILYGRAGEYGYECRSLFGPPEGWWQMGCDLSGVELRCFAARLAEFDDGDYVLLVLNGDPHTKNMIAFQIDNRDTSKTCLYAILYGAGDEKAGSIVCPAGTSIEKLKARGKQLKANFQNGIPAFGKLMKKISREARKGFLTSLDGGKLYVRSPHAALNLQLQSDGAILAKTWVCMFYDLMAEAGYVHGVDWGMQAWVHDEIQAACRTKEIAEHAAVICVEAAKLAGEFYNYASPIAAEAKIGRTWAETH